MRKTETLHCGGIVDGEECKACVWVEDGLGSGYWLCKVLPPKPSYTTGEYRIYAESNGGHCAVCGVKLGVTPEGEPTREMNVTPRALALKQGIEEVFDQLGEYHYLREIHSGLSALFSAKSFRNLMESAAMYQEDEDDA